MLDAQDILDTMIEEISRQYHGTARKPHLDESDDDYSSFDIIMDRWGDRRVPSWGEIK